NLLRQHAVAGTTLGAMDLLARYATYGGGEFLYGQGSPPNSIPPSAAGPCGTTASAVRSYLEVGFMTWYALLLA
ncbi:MAG: hypothetical protein ABI614_08060, partial [Planctomycetota bacterium]